MHHSLIDGASGVEILASLFDLEPEPEPKRHPTSRRSGSPSTCRATSSCSAIPRSSFAQRPVQFVKAANNLGRSVVRGVQRARERELDVALPLTAPRLSMNRSITPHRKVAFASVPLADIKAAKNALGVTVNDIVLARHRRRAAQLPARRDRSCPIDPLVAAIPTNVRAEGERELGNRVSTMFASLPVEIENPARARRRRRDARPRVEAGRTRSSSAATLEEWAGVAAPDGVLRRRSGSTAGCASASAAAGDQPDRVERARPVVPALPRGRPARRACTRSGPILDDCGLNLTVMSYLDHVDFGFIACRELVPDVDELAAAVPDALAEIVEGRRSDARQD